MLPTPASPIPTAPARGGGVPTQAAAWLHLLLGLLVLGGVLALWLAAAQLAPLFQGSFIPDLFAWLGRPVAVAFLLFGAFEAGAAVALLGRRSWARWPLMAVALLQIWIFPIGTAVAAYTFWALLRRGPPAAPF